MITYHILFKTSGGGGEEEGGHIRKLNVVVVQSTQRNEMYQKCDSQVFVRHTEAFSFSVPIPMLPIFYVPHIVVLYLPKLYFRIQLFSYNIVHII